jgi:hypothetical protein
MIGLINSIPPFEADVAAFETPEPALRIGGMLADFRTYCKASARVRSAQRCAL